jgi:predicted NUDIX family phosphoesterase
MERVLCVRARDLWEMLGNFQGFRPITNPHHGLRTDYDLLLGGSCEMAWLERTSAEQDPSWKQLIPYVVFGHLLPPPDPNEVQVMRKPPEPVEIFHYRRSKGQGESRLHDKLSIGVGGHINPVDVNPESANPSVPTMPIKSFDPKDAYWRGLRRELDEELHNRHSVWSEPKLKGLIFDGSNAVGDVHLGMVHTILLDERAQIEPKDPNMADPDWSFVPSLQRMENLESWTEILLPHLSGLFT